MFVVLNLRKKIHNLWRKRNKTRHDSLHGAWNETCTRLSSEKFLSHVLLSDKLVQETAKVFEHR